MSDYKTFEVEQIEKVAHVRLNRPDKANAMSEDVWREIHAIFDWADTEPSVRAVVFSANGKHFCSGIDLTMMAGLGASLGKEVGRNARLLRRKITELQDALSAIERCSKPVLAAIHGCCYGGGIDLVAACDMRYCTEDARFCIKEVDIGMAADVGTLQRLPYIIGDGLMRELAYTGRVMGSGEAGRAGLVNAVYPDHGSLVDAVLEKAQLIAAKSPIAVQGTKEMLIYTRDHSVEEGLNYVASWNAAMLQSDDLKQAIMAQMTKQTPVFDD